MAQKTTNGFKGRAFVSTTIGLSFVGMCVTGIILFIVPPGRVANWTGWTIFGLTKAQWQGLHIWLSLVFMVAGFVHLYYNWRPLLSYFKGKVGKTLALRWEWVLSLLVCVIVSAGTVAGVKPFSSLVDWNESLKQRWDDNRRRAPIPHAELLTLAELTEYVDDITVETILANLRSHGISVESAEQVVGELAAAHNMTPDALYRIAVGSAHTGPGRGGGGGRGAGGRGVGGGRGGQGIGRMTLQEYCASVEIEVGAAIEKLREAGLTATEGMTLRQIADAAGLHPSQVRQMLE